VTPGNELVLPLDGAHGAEPAIVGGKGAWLDRLAAAGFRVPPAVALTTEAYRAYVRGAGLEPLLARLAADPGADPDGDEVAAAFLAAPLPGPVDAAITAAAGLVRSAPGARLAVRSSATAEDMGEASFAGQYRSFLDLTTDDELRTAVRAVWASLWLPAPRAYRRFHGLGRVDPAMAVVVMPMVAAERAGVAFTVDPGGEPDHVRVETVSGLGEALVSGEATPDVALVPRASAAVPPGPGPVTADELDLAVARLALGVERAFGAPQDIEWAWDGVRLRVLQARPITTVTTPPDDDGFDTPADPDRRYTTAGIAEMLPGVLPPLLWDVNGTLTEEAFRSLFDGLGALPVAVAAPHGMIGRFRGRAALDLSRLKEIAQAVPGGSEDEVERQYFGPTAAGATSPPPDRGRGLRGLAHDLRVTEVRHRALRSASIAMVAVDRLDEVPVDPAALGDAALLARRRRVLDLAGRLAGAEAAVAAASVAAYRRLELALARHVGEQDADRWAQYVTVGGGPAGLGGGFARARASMAVVGGPTWDEAGITPPAPARGSGTGPEGAPAPRAAAERFTELATHLQQLPGWRRHRILTGQLVDARVAALRRAADDARDLLARRERAKASLLALGGEVRRIHLEIGRRLVASGRLEEVADVDLLGDAELAVALAGDPPTLAELARRRRWLAEVAEEGPLPVRFVGRPEARRPELGGGDVFLGWGAGPGVHHGRARVLRRPGDEPFERGDVLVATTTDASWSPRFLDAGGIVVEQGGPLSHAAIVARELGIPAVLNLPGIVDRLAGTDVLVTVDGDEGVVVIHDPDRPDDGDRATHVEGGGRHAALPARSAASAAAAPDPEPVHELGVIVPAVLGAGLLFSALTYARDLGHRLRGRHVLARREALAGNATAGLVVDPDGDPELERRDLRPRSAFVAVGLVDLALAGYLTVAATGNYRGLTHWAQDIAWLWGVFLGFALAFAILGVAALGTAVRWSHPPAWARRVIAASPLTRSPVRWHRPHPPGTRHLLPVDSAQLRRLALGWSAAVLVGFGYLAVTRGVPRAPEGGTLDAAIAVPAQVVLLAVAAVGALLAWRFEAVGAVLLAVAATGLGLFASVQYRPVVALAAFAALGVPAFLHWFAWRRRRSGGAIVALAAVTAVVLGVVWVGADRVYGHYFGPAHPGSAVTALPPSDVDWVWAGATTATETTVVARIRGSGPADVRLAVDDDPSFPAPRWTELRTADDAGDRVVRFTVPDLAPDRTYHYALEVDGALDEGRRGRVRTLPVGPASFRLALASCARNGSNGAVFDAIRERDPLVYVNVGDFNYANIDTDDQAAFRDAYRTTLRPPAQSALYRSTSVGYVWDDHDYGANDATRDSPTRPAAMAVYRDLVPHYPLAGDDAPIFQSFTAGRVRVVMLDGRSARSPAGEPEPTMLGDDQLRWLEGELRAARDGGQVVVLAAATPWIAPADAASDTWGGYADERARLASFIADEGIAGRMVMVTGDAHMVALDDGTNAGYAPGGTGGFPVLNAAALDRPGGTKGGPYSDGMFPGGGQFGEVEVVDRGTDTITVTLRGLTWEGEVLVERTFSLVP
jgi:rifampicin phosphotransferase